MKKMVFDKLKKMLFKTNDNETTATTESVAEKKKINTNDNETTAMTESVAEKKKKKINTYYNETTTESAETKKMLILMTNDDETFEVEESIAIQSVLIKNMVEDECALNVIPLTNVSSKTLIKIIEYLKAHAQADSSLKNDDEEVKEELKNFDKNYLEGLNNVEIIELICAANYLNIPGVFDVACQKVTDTIRDMKVEEVRKYFGIVCDLTPKEEQELRNEHAWAFQ